MTANATGTQSPKLHLSTSALVEWSSTRSCSILIPSSAFAIPSSAFVSSNRRSSFSSNRPKCASNSSLSSARSEEHTSELQSLAYLVCRLLLEKKKKYNKTQHRKHATNLLSTPPTDHTTTCHV